MFLSSARSPGGGFGEGALNGGFERPGVNSGSFPSLRRTKSYDAWNARRGHKKDNNGARGNKKKRKKKKDIWGGERAKTVYRKLSHTSKVRSVAPRGARQHHRRSRDQVRLMMGPPDPDPGPCPCGPLVVRVRGCFAAQPALEPLSARRPHPPRRRRWTTRHKRVRRLTASARGCGHRHLRS